LIPNWSTDLGVLVVYTFHDYILYNDTLLILMNGGLWLPQIAKSFQERSRQGPSPYFVTVLSGVHVFFPLYLRGCPKNLFDAPTSYLAVSILTTLVALQAILVLQQQKRNPRFFVPKRWRRNFNAYNYFHEFPREPTSTTDNEKAEIQGEDEDCIICMTSLRMEMADSAEATQRKAKYFMKTPCNHKYHVACLKKWMEVRLECPACRQQIPVLEDD